MIVHVKLTEHFLIQAGERMTKRDRGEMTTFLLSPTLFRIAEALSPGERAAACLGDGLIVFCRDAADSSVLAVLTYLGPDEAHVVSRRFDTTLVRVEATM